MLFKGGGGVMAYLLFPIFNLIDDEKLSVPAGLGLFITQDMNDYLMRPISLEELEEVVFGMPNGKAPGPDGFLVEFF